MAGGQRRTLTTALFAIAVSIALVCGQATGFSPLVSLVNTVIGIGGSSDPLSERLPAKLSNTVVPVGDTYIATEYPASLNLDSSLRVGMPVLHQNLETTSGKVLVAGYSLGALLVEQLKRDVAASDDPPSPQELSFLQIATPFVPNGGIFARFPGLSIPNVVSAMGPGQPTQYDTTYIVNEYDLWGDFPAYFNPLSIVNAILGHEYAHVDTWYDQVDPNDPANHVKEVTDPVTGGTETYILVPASRLPLLGPLRDIAYHLSVSGPAERLFGLVEPLLRVIVDMGYTDRLNLNPEVRTPFSLFTPPHKIIEALNAVPGAVREGLENLVGKKRTPVTIPVPTPLAATAAQSTTEKAPKTVAEDAPEAEVEETPKVEARTDDEIEAPPTITKRPTRTPVVTLRDSPRSASGDNRTVPKRTKAPARSERSGQDSRDGGAEAA